MTTHWTFGWTWAELYRIQTTSFQSSVLEILGTLRHTISQARSCSIPPQGLESLLSQGVFWSGLWEVPGTAYRVCLLSPSLPRSCWQLLTSLTWFVFSGHPLSLCHHDPFFSRCPGRDAYLPHVQLTCFPHTQQAWAGLVLHFFEN